MHNRPASVFSRIDWIAAAALWVTTIAVYAIGASKLGFYYDDGGWMLDFPQRSLSVLFWQAVHYIPGRNLFPVWMYLFLISVGDPLRHLMALHAIVSTLDGALTGGFFLILRALRIPGPAAVIGAALFAFWPFHGETHLWMNDLPENLMSTFWVLVFIGTSIALLRRESKPRFWLWMLDFAALFCALFTYDQVFAAVGWIVAVRAALGFLGGLEKRSRFLLLQSGHIALLLVYLWLKLGVTPGESPSLRTPLGAVIQENARDTMKILFGGDPFVAQFYWLLRKATHSDWVFAAFIGLAIAGLAVCFGRNSKSSVQGAVRILAAGVVFAAAGYAPTWVWYMSARHHLLPSLGLFAAVAAGLTLIGAVLPGRVSGLVTILTGGLLVTVFVATDRVELSEWANAYVMKHAMFQQIEPDLKGKEVLILEGFPRSFGHAPLIYPQDARFAPKLLFSGPFLGNGFTGDVGSAPAPHGVFLFVMTSLYGSERFVYRRTDKVLTLRFNSMEDGRITFVKAASETPPYSSSIHLAASSGAFAVGSAAARRDGSETTLSLDVMLPGESSLAATVTYLADRQFHDWVKLDGLGHAMLQPLILYEDSGDSFKSGVRLTESVLLKSFPPTDRLGLTFYTVSSEGAPVRLGHVEVAVAH